VREGRADGEDAAEHEGAAVIGRAVLVIGALAIVGVVSTVGPPSVSPAGGLPEIQTTPLYSFDEPPPSDFPGEPGARAVWFEGRPLAQLVEPGDRLVEVVQFTAPPFTAPLANATAHAAEFTPHASIVLLVTVDDVSGRVVDLHGRPGAWIESTVRARVDRVFKNVSSTPIRERETIGYQLFNTGETRFGDTRVIVRRMSSRVPRRSGQYVVFLFSCGGGPLREMNDGAIEIEESVARPMRRPNPWGRGTDAAAVLTLIADQAASGGAFDFCRSGSRRTEAP
jgi:hypothetical protein